MIKVGVADYGLFVWDGEFYDYEDRVDMVHSLGYDGIERLPASNPGDAISRAAMLKKKGLGFGTCKSTLVEESIKWTAALGGEYIWADIMRTPEFDTYCRRVNTLIETCEKYQIRVGVHNHLEQTVETQEQLETFLQRCPKAGIILDTGHLFAAGGDPVYIAEKYFDRLCAVHMKNRQTSDTPNAEHSWERGYFCGLAQGDIIVPNKEVLDVLIKKGYDKWVFIEHDEHKQDPKIDLKNSYDKLVEWGIRK